MNGLSLTYKEAVLLRDLLRGGITRHGYDFTNVERKLTRIIEKESMSMMDFRRKYGNTKPNAFEL